MSGREMQVGSFGTNEAEAMADRNSSTLPTAMHPAFVAFVGACFWQAAVALPPTATPATFEALQVV